MKIDPFLILLIVAVILSYFLPQLAVSEKINLDRIINIGIVLIFFFYGLKLSFAEIKQDLKNIKLHILVQLSTFLLFPLIILLAKPFVFNESGEIVWLAFMFLAALPSTVSTSVVMVNIAKGNVPAAIFNATISGIIGIMITPLWMGLFVSGKTANYNWGPIYMKLVLEILAPIILGLLIQYFIPKIHEIVLKQAKKISMFDKFVILLIVYNSFAISFESKIFNSVNALNFSLIVIGSIALFYAVYGITGFVGRKLKFNKKDSICLQFSGTKKSLLHGTVFSEVLFANTSISMGIILLPIMIYHAFQILVISFIASKKGQEQST
ncbi:MAG: bile acid:sodium symporter [Bacteroidales bacterium]|nr:bile acid:sodium symporter [Bacteroidales bacterium]